MACCSVGWRVSRRGRAGEVVVRGRVSMYHRTRVGLGSDGVVILGELVWW